MTTVLIHDDEIGLASQCVNRMMSAYSSKANIRWGVRHVRLLIAGFAASVLMTKCLITRRSRSIATAASVTATFCLKQLALIAGLPPHHDPPPPLNESSERESWHPDNHEPFFNAIGHKRKW
jgi:hypothetical protein